MQIGHEAQNTYSCPINQFTSIFVVAGEERSRVDFLAIASPTSVCAMGYLHAPAKSNTSFLHTVYLIHHQKLERLKKPISTYGEDGNRRYAPEAYEESRRENRQDREAAEQYSSS